MTFLALLLLAALLLLLVSGVAFLLRNRVTDVGSIRELVHAGEETKALALLEEVVRREPENVPARWLLARLLESRGDPDGVIRAALPLVEPWNAPSLPAGTPAPRLPEDVSLGDVVERLVEAHLALGRSRDAFVLARHVVRNVRVAGGASGAREAVFIEPRLLEICAETAERCGDSREALEAYAALRDEGALSPARSFAFGRLLLKENRPDESLEALKTAAEFLPERSDVRLVYAEALTAAGRHKEAWEVYRALYEGASGRERIHVGLLYADTLEDVGNLKGAVAVLEEMAGMEEARPGEAAEMLCRIGDIHVKLESPGEAEAWWRRALEKQADHPGACRRLGIAEKPRSAAHLARHVRSLAPENFRKMFEGILVDWGYTVEHVREPDLDSLRFAVSRYEDGKDRRKLVWVSRGESEVGTFPLQDLRAEVLGKNFDAGVFITMSHYSSAAVSFAARARCLELFSHAELFPLVEHIELPR